MASILKRGFTFANVVAVLALTISLSGGVYAAAKINGKDIKKQSIAGKKLKNDTLTGKQIKESALQGVASSEALKGLASAANMQRLRFEQTATNGSVERPLLALGSFRMGFLCDAIGVAELQASTTGASAAYDVSLVLDAGGAEDYGAVGGLLSSTPKPLFNTPAIPNNSYARLVGTLVYNSNAAGETITVEFAIFYQRSNSGTYCNVAGTAMRVPA